jgi:hypothetical protein
MQQYTKGFRHKGYVFMTSITLNTKAEKRINGKIWHTIITKDMGVTDYYVKDEITDDMLKEFIVKHEYDAKRFVDKQEKESLSPNQILLTSLGFSKIN